MPIVNVANHFIESNGNPVDPDGRNQRRKRKDNEDKQKK